jgi:hypothetical protein
MSMKLVPILAAISVLAAAATANAPLRYPTFVPIGAGITLNPDVDGMAIVRYNSSTGYSRVQVMVSGLQPNQTYGVLVGDVHTNPQGLQVFARGTGSYVGEWIGPAHTQDPVIIIYKYDEHDSPWEPLEENQRAAAAPM